MTVAFVLAAFYESPDGGHHFRGHLVGASLGGTFMHAVPGVAVEQAESHFVQSGLDGGDLGKDIDE